MIEYVQVEVQLVEMQTEAGRRGSLAGAGGSYVYCGKIGLAEAEMRIDYTFSRKDEFI